MLCSSVVVELLLSLGVLVVVLGTETGVMMVPGTMWMLCERARDWYLAR